MFQHISRIFLHDVTITPLHLRTELGTSYSPGTVICSSLGKAVYDPKAFFLHAALLPQPFGHWGKFSTAASRRSVSSISVSLRQVALSRLLSVVALVSRYLTN